MGGISRSVPGRVCAFLLSLVLVAGPVFQAVPAFASSEETTGANSITAPESAGGSQDPGGSSTAATAEKPTVVRELVDMRTATSTSYELSNGETLVEMTEVPTRFEDERGEWVDIDTSLVPAAETGAVETLATSATVTFDRQEPSEAPVTLGAPGHEIGIDMLGVAENARVVIGDTARYLDVAPHADLEYQATRSGIKETVVLRNPQAQSTYTFRIDLDGLVLRQSPFGAFSLYDETTDERLYDLGELVVFDSSVNAADEPAYCPDATMRVASTGDGDAIVTYDVPREWLDDPARVYPVMVDPTITGASVTADTYYTSAYPNNGYGSSDELKVGYYDSSTGHNRSYVKFDWSTSTIPANAYVSTAKFSAYCFHQYYTTATTNVRIGRVTSAWGGSWNNKPTYSFLDTTNVTGRGDWAELEVGSTVQDWVNGAANYGFQLYQLNPEDNTTHWKKFRSSDYSNSSYLPKLYVSYSNPGLSGCSVDKTVYRVGDTVRATIRMGTGIPEDVNCLRAVLKGLNSSGARVTKGEFQWTEDAPSSGWGTPTTGLSGTGGGFVSSRSLSGVDLLETQCLENVPNDSSSTQDFAEVTFVFKVLSAYGNIQDNDFDVTVMMNPTNKNDTGNRWTSSVKPFNSSFSVLQDQPPVAVASATPTAQSAQAQFSSAGSSDDFGIVAYAWDFNGDGNTDSTAQNPLYTFDGGGLRAYSLTVRDSAGQTNTISKTVFVSPAVGLMSPIDTVTPPDLDCMWYYDSTSPQVAYEIEVTTSTAGPVAASTGQVTGGSDVAALPEPEGGWDADAGYRVRMRAASARQDGTGLMWSAWTDSAAFELTHQPVAAAAASAKSRNPVLVFVTGYRNQQMEYGTDLARLGDVEDVVEDRTFSALLNRFGSTHRIIRVPSQYGTERKKVASKYRKLSMWNKGGIHTNGNRIMDYLKASTVVTTSGGIRPYILVCYSKGGLDSRALLDSTCNTVSGGKKYRDKCVGVIQIGSPNYGSGWANTGWERYWPRFQAKATVQLQEEGIPRTDANVIRRAKKLARAANPGLYDLRTSMWSKEGADNDYNDHLANRSRISYVRFGGKYEKWEGGYGSGDCVVSVASAHGSSKLRGDAGYTGILYRGVHTFLFSKWGFKIDFPNAKNRTHIMANQTYPTDDLRYKYQNQYLSGYAGALNHLKKRASATAAASYMTEAEVQESQGISAAYATAMHEIEAASLDEPSLAPVEPQLVTNFSVDDAEEPAVRTIAASGPIVLENLPAGTVVTAQDLEGNDLTIQSVESTEPLDPDDAEALGEFAPDFETVTVSVEETGTYMIEIDSPDEGEALLYELGGPVLECEPPAFVAAGESMIVTMSVSLSSEQDPATGWSYLADVGEVGVSPNDLGAWPDEVAGDGVATVLMPPLSPGEHGFEVQATSNDTEQARAMMTDVVALDVGSVSIGQGLGVSTRFEAGLIAERIVSVPVQGSEDTTQPVTIEAILVSGSDGESQVVSVDTTLTPGASQVCTLGVPAASLAGLGDGAVALSEVTVMARDEYLDYVDPGAAAIPLSRLEPSGVGFTNDLDGIELQEVQATVLGDDVTSALTFTVAGEARFNGASVDGVRYSLDDGQTWYEAKAEDGQWGASREEFSMDVAVAEPGPYFVSIRPVSDGIEWQTGCEVAVVAGAE